MKKILITRRLLRSSEDKASKIFDAKFNINDELYSQEKLIKLSAGCDGILSALTDKLDAETINKLPNSVKILSNFAVGFGNIDLEAAKKRNIIVTNTPEVLTDATAEIGILLILGACRRAPEGIEAAKSSNWKWSADYLIGKQLTGTRLGILGMGRIGRKIYAVGLDVYKNEPNLNPGYSKIKSAFILPHLGSATKDTRIAMANLAIDNIDEFFKTGNCKNKVT